MALNVCDNCTTEFSVGAEWCPACGTKDYHEAGTELKPKPKPKKASS